MWISTDRHHLVPAVMTQECILLCSSLWSIWMKSVRTLDPAQLQSQQSQTRVCLASATWQTEDTSTHKEECLERKNTMTPIRILRATTADDVMRCDLMGCWANGRSFGLHTCVYVSSFIHTQHRIHPFHGDNSN